MAQPNGVKRFPALETRFHYQHDTPLSPSSAGTSVEMSETVEEVERWKKGKGVKDCFNALITTEMAASDYHQLQRKGRLTTPFFFFQRE